MSLLAFQPHTAILCPRIKDLVGLISCHAPFYQARQDACSLTIAKYCQKKIYDLFSLQIVKLQSLKSEIRYTPNMILVKLVGSQAISQILLRISDIKRTKMVG